VITNASTGTYTLTLNDNVLHTNADGTEASVTVDIPYLVNDIDSSVTGTIHATFNDDTPIATDDGSSAVEGTTLNVTTSLLANDEFGADGALGGTEKVTSVTHGATTVSTPNGSGDLVIGGSAGTLTIHADGTYSYLATQGSIPPAGVVETFTYTITDGDGDTDTATLTINVANNGLTPTAGTVNAFVDDEGLTGGNLGNGNSSGDINANAGEVGSGTSSEAVWTGMLQGSGGDAPLSFRFAAALDGTTIVGGVGTEAAHWEVSNGGLTLEAVGARGTIFTVTITDAATGAYTLTLNDNVLHTDGDGTEASVTVDIPYTVNDIDSSVGGTIHATFNDDTPVNFTPQPMTDDGTTLTPEDDSIVNDGNGLETNPLNDANNDGVGENFIGADGFGDLYFTEGTHTDGEQLRSTGGALLTSGGQPIYMVGYGTGTLTGYQESGDTAGFQEGEDTTVVFTVTLNEGTGNGSNSSYTIDFNLPIDDGSGTVFDDFSAVKAGQKEWVGVDADKVDTDNDGDLDAIDIESPLDPNANSLDLLITPYNGVGTINTDADDIGNANQWIDDGEGIRLDFVTDIRRDGTDDESDEQGYLFDGHGPVTDAGFTVIQTKSGGGEASILVRAVFDDDSGDAKDLDGTTVDIDPDSVVVTGDSDGTWEVIDMGDGTIVITGLDAGAHVEFETLNGEVFNAVELVNATDIINPDTDDPFGGDDFALGEFGFTSETAGSDIGLSFDVTAEDQDGDTSTGTINVNLTPADSDSLAASSLLATNMIESKEALTTQDTSHTLVSTNDNQRVFEDHRSFNNAALIGAIAGAGLTSATQAAAHHIGGNELVGHANSGPMAVQPHSVAAPSQGGDSALQSVSASLGQTVAADHGMSANHLSTFNQSSDFHGLAHNEVVRAVSALAHNAEASDQVADQSAMTAASITMPSAQQLVAANLVAPAPSPANSGAAHVEGHVVGQVLADALHGGGGHSANLDAIINSLPTHGSHGGALEALASHGDAAVSFGHTGVFAGFSPNAMPVMEQFVMHQDAIQAHS
jgi:hypothetical protein